MHRSFGPFFAIRPIVRLGSSCSWCRSLALSRRKISTNRIGGFVRRVFYFDMDPVHHVRDAAHLPCRAAKSVQTESVASFVAFSTSAWTWFIMFVMPLACLVAPQNQYKHDRWLRSSRFRTPLRFGRRVDDRVQCPGQTAKSVQALTVASFVAFPCDGPLASFVTFLCGPCCPTSFAVLQIAIVVAWLITRKISKSVIGGFVRYVFASLDSLSRNAGADSTTTNRSRTTDHGPRTRQER